MRVCEYTLTDLKDESNGTFRISSSAATNIAYMTAAGRKSLDIVRSGAAVTFSVVSQSEHTLEVFDLNGALLARYAGNGAATYITPDTQMRSGAYIIRYRADGKTVERRVLMTGER